MFPVHCGARIPLAALSLGASLMACAPGSRRPAVAPFPDAPTVEVRGSRADAIQALADTLRGRGFPLRRLEARDAYLETPWIDTAGYAAATGRPIGEGVVRLRGWADPGRWHHSIVTIEVAWRPAADPARPERDLERPVPATHPVAVRAREMLAAMAPKPRVRPPEPRDSAPADSTPAAGVPVVAGGDSAASRVRPPDTLPRDTTPPAVRTRAAASASRPNAEPNADSAAAPRPAPATAPPATRSPAGTASPDTTPRLTPAAAEVQVAAVRTQAAADQWLAALRAESWDGRALRDGGLIKVRAGFPSRRAALAALPAIRARLAPTAFLVTP